MKIKYYNSKSEEYVTIQTSEIWIDDKIFIEELEVDKSYFIAGLSLFDHKVKKVGENWILETLRDGVIPSYGETTQTKSELKGHFRGDNFILT